MCATACLSGRWALPLCALGHNNWSDVRVRAVNALMRLCIAQALLSGRCSHINRHFCLISWHVFQVFVFCDFVPEEEAISCLKKKPILVWYQSIFTLIKVKKILNTYKMYMETLIYLISRVKCLILTVKDQNNQLIKHHYVFCNVTTKQSAPSFLKIALSIFQLKNDCEGR